MSESAGKTTDVELDEEAKQLQLAAEKAKYRQAIAEAAKAAQTAAADGVQSVAPKVEGAPTGATTVDKGAGSLGPWQAHARLQKIAGDIAAAARIPLTKGKDARVLVTEDQGVLEGDWAARIVSAESATLSRRLERLIERCTQSRTQLGRALEEYRNLWPLAVPSKDTAPRSESEPPVERGDPDVGLGASGTEEVTKATPAAIASGALASSVGLIGLLGADFTLSAVAVNARASELAVLTAGALVSGGADITVELASLGVVGASASLVRFRKILELRDRLTETVTDLQSAVGPVTAEQSDLLARIAAQEKVWTEAVGKSSAQADHLEQTLTALRERSIHLSKAVAPAATFDAYARKVLEDVGTSLTALTKGQDGKEAPLLTAVRWERMRWTITHVLYVSADSIATDVATRRSILGSSGVLQYISSANASWVLVDAKDSTVVGGGEAKGYDIMAHSLQNGVVETVASKTEAPAAQAVILGKGRSQKTVIRSLEDPLAALENLARALVIALVISMILGFAALAAHSVAELIQSAWR